MQAFIYNFHSTFAKGFWSSESKAVAMLRCTGLKWIKYCLEGYSASGGKGIWLLEDIESENSSFDDCGNDLRMSLRVMMGAMVNATFSTSIDSSKASYFGGGLSNHDISMPAPNWCAANLCLAWVYSLLHLASIYKDPFKVQNAC
jgi:hypothetical protein